MKNRRSILGFSDVENNKKELFGSFQERDKMLASSIRYRTISKSIVEAKECCVVVLIAASVYQIQSKRWKYLRALFCPTCPWPMPQGADIRQTWVALRDSCCTSLRTMLLCTGFR